jgi:serine/threonine protein kinase
MKSELTVLDGPDAGRRFELIDGQTLIIGRGQSTDARLNDPRISRQHCRIQVDGASVVLSDADSAAGTLVNGSSIEQHALQPGDVVEIGDTKLRFQLEGRVDQSTLIDTAFGRPKPPPKVTPLEQLVGQTIEHFKLEGIIARGVSGMVFRATDTNKNRGVAVKILYPEYAGSDEQKERFVRGIKTMAPIRHENIVRLYAAGMQGPYCWMAMEYVDGESMTEVIDRIGVSGMLDWQYAYRVGVHIGRALDEAYQHKIIHRNVTPQNILFRSADKVAKLCDLTLAKALEGTQSRQVTQPGELVGDVSYMSPERTRGHKEVDGRSDIYGLGAALYALLTGHPPFEGTSLPELITRIRNEEPVKPKEFQLSVPDMFQDIVLRMIAKRPEDRYQTPAELLKDLERVGKFQNVTT